MAKLPIPKFNLRKPKSDSPTLISLVYRYRGNRLVHSTGYSVLPSEWDFTKQRPVLLEDRIDLMNINHALEDLASLATSIYVNSNYGLLDINEFKTKLNPNSDKENSPTSQTAKTFFDFLKEELAEMQATGMKQSSFKIFRRHAGILGEFRNDRGDFDFSDIDWNFRLELIDWLTKRNVQLAYGNKTLGMLRQFMERARRKKLHNNTQYNGAGWSIPPKKANGEKIILTIDELQVLASLKLHGMHKKARDLFLIGAGTGQRFSDFSRYTPQNFYTTASGIMILSVISQKTDTPAKIPLNLFPWLLPILEEHNYSSPKLAMQNLNDTIKEVCEEAGFTKETLIVEQYMGRKARIQKTFVKKYEVISSHACRRSFATNLYRMGYSLAQIMPMTGHTTETQLREYIGIDAEENAEQIALSILANQRAAKFTNR